MRLAVVIPDQFPNAGFPAPWLSGGVNGCVRGESPGEAQRRGSAITCAEGTPETPVPGEPRRLAMRICAPGDSVPATQPNTIGAKHLAEVSTLAHMGQKCAKMFQQSVQQRNPRSGGTFTAVTLKHAATIAAPGSPASKNGPKWLKLNNRRQSIRRSADAGASVSPRSRSCAKKCRGSPPSHRARRARCDEHAMESQLAPNNGPAISSRSANDAAAVVVRWQLAFFFFFLRHSHKAFDSKTRYLATQA